MWRRFKSSFIADCKIISNNASFIVAFLIPVFMVIFLKLLFNPLSNFIFSRTGFHLSSYYSLTAISLVSTFPIFFGLIYAFIPLTLGGKRSYLLVRMLKPAFVSFAFVLLSIILVDPVSTEGWLRNLYAAFLISTQSVIVFLFNDALLEKKIARLVLSWIYGILLIATPLGLLLHHPWNYFVFFSPPYWISWAWIVQSPVESLYYGLMAVILTSSAIIVLSRYYLRKNSV